MKIDVVDPVTGEILDQLELPLDEEGVPTKAVLDQWGRELVDCTPVAPPIGFKPTLDLPDLVRKMVQSEQLAARAREAGFGDFSEEDDFEVGEDFDPSSPYEEVFEGVTRLDIQEHRGAIEAELARRDSLPKKGAPTVPPGLAEERPKGGATSASAPVEPAPVQPPVDSTLT